MAGIWYYPKFMEMMSMKKILLSATLVTGVSSVGGGGKQRW